jgi:flavin reductase (DIM6/NTAB) family NADH-FMN oxidoreductase RutF
MDVDPLGLPPGECTWLINSLVVPRPIAWISTVDADGVGNLAPFSYFNVADGGSPPVLMVSFSPKGAKHSLDNIRSTGEFVVNIVSDWQRELMNASSAEFPSHVDELQELELPTAASTAVRPPRLAEAAAALECRTYGIHAVNDSTVVFGTVVHVHVRDELFVDGRVDPELLRPVARLGGSLYTTVESVYRMQRPGPIAKEGSPSQP